MLFQPVKENCGTDSNFDFCPFSGGLLQETLEKPRFPDFGLLPKAPGVAKTSGLCEKTRGIRHSGGSKKGKSRTKPQAAEGACAFTCFSTWMAHSSRRRRSVRREWSCIPPHIAAMAPPCRS